MSTFSDITFMRTVWKFFNIFLITPFYNFNENTIHSKLCKLYATFLIALKLVWIVALFKNENLSEMVKQFLFTQKFTFVAGLATLSVLNLLSVIKSSFLDINTWKMLVKSFDAIDSKLQTGGKVETSICKNFCFGFITKQLIFMIFVTYQLYCWSSFLKISVLQSLWASPTCDLMYEFQIFTFLMSLLQSIKRRYVLLNEKVEAIKTSPKMRHELQKLAQVYRILGETIETWNKLFGYQILLITFQSGLNVVSCINFPLGVLDRGNFDIEIALCNGIFLLLTLSCFIWMVMVIDSTTREAETFITLCYKLQENNEIDAFGKITIYAQHFTRNFTAVGFFRIRKNIIFSIIGNAATYLIIAIQFNERQPYHS
ncbi:gustatory receptor 111 [Tribolium castaneum]|uniref:Gustatory receptor n=1 Tax=Tribolium castaneum TaxID=7070 RepID=D6WRP8_TRICA|nr:gustatory receptor 111 [Tribolium castaneum]